MRRLIAIPLFIHGGDHLFLIALFWEKMYASINAPGAEYFIAWSKVNPCQPIHHSMTPEKIAQKSVQLILLMLVQPLGKIQIRRLKAAQIILYIASPTQCCFAAVE